MRYQTFAWQTSELSTSAEIDFERGFVVSDVSQLSTISLSTEASHSKLTRRAFSACMRLSRILIRSSGIGYDAGFSEAFCKKS
jgi:hypothetical protein